MRPQTAIPGVPPSPRALGLSGPARKPLIHYGVALLAVAVAWLADRELLSIVGIEAPYLFFMPAVLVAAGIGGLGPGLLATTLSTGVVLFALKPHTVFWSTEILDDVIFALIGGGIAWIGGELHRSRR